MGLFSRDIKTLNDLFVHTLRHIYYAEKQIVKALPGMIEKASEPGLKRGFKTASTSEHALGTRARHSSAIAMQAGHRPACTSLA
jgi:hypothetical protein